MVKCLYIEDYQKRGFKTLKKNDIAILNLSKIQQILIVTHLPQVAARGQQHFKTSKSSKNDMTVTGVKELSYEDRIEEVASMISGDQITDEARLLSERLLNHIS